MAWAWENFFAGAKKWTRLQPIRTLAEIDLEFTVFIAEPFQYQEYSSKVVLLKQLGMRNSEIARALGLEQKTVKRALRWSKLHCETD